MKYLMICCMIAAIAPGVSRLGVYAQNEAPTAKPWKCIGCSVDGKTTPRMQDGHPDLNGYWNPPDIKNHVGIRGPDGTVLFDFGGDQLDAQGRPILSVQGQLVGVPSADPSRNASYKPEYGAKVKDIASRQYGFVNQLDPELDCKPHGVPRSGAGGNSGNVMQVFQTPDAIAVLYEDAPGPQFRIIYTDGRPHPDDLDPTFMGDSIGHWEGDTLVVDVIGFNDETWLTETSAYTSIHSDQEHVIERWTRKGDDLTYEATVEDPVMLTKPWIMPPRHSTHAGPDDRSYIFYFPCRVNDKSHIIQPTKDDQYECNYCIKKKTQK